jgi:cobalt-zinc-cadmium efflux system outer membrane protein
VNFRFVSLPGIAGLWCVALACGAQSLKLDQAVSRSLASAPLLQARSAELQATSERARRESLPAPYYLSADIENVAGGGALSGTDAAEVTLRVGRTLELGGKRAAREALGSAETSLREHELAVTRGAISDLATRRFIEVLADQHRLRLAQDIVALAEATRREVSRFVESARNAESDLRIAEISLADAELEREHAEHELASARVTLASTWGSWQPEFEQVDGELFSLPEAGSLARWQSRVADAPALRRRQLELGITGARRAVARASASPDVNLSLGVRRLEAFDDNGLVLGASLPLGNRSRSRLAQSAAEADAGALAGYQQDDLADTHQRLFESHQELIHARTEYTTVSQQMVPKAEQALALVQQGFERGRLPLTTLLQAQRSLFELRRRSVDAAARYHEILSGLRLIAGLADGELP